MLYMTLDNNSTTWPTVQELAHRQNVSQDAIYKRIHRGKAESYRDEEGRTRVQPTLDKPAKMSYDKSTEKLIAALQEQAAYFREKLEEERRRNDALVERLMALIPEPTPSQEQRQPPESE